MLHGCSPLYLTTHTSRTHRALHAKGGRLRGGEESSEMFDLSQRVGTFPPDELDLPAVPPQASRSAKPGVCSMCGCRSPLWLGYASPSVARIHQQVLPHGSCRYSHPA